MDYLDIWFFDRRPRMKVFFCYALIFVLFFIFSDFLIAGFTKSLYKPMTSYEINITSPQVTITSAEASNVNGNVKGTIKNTTDEPLDDKYLKFDFYTPRNVCAGTKYLEVEYLVPEEEKNYELGFKYDNVSSVKVSMVDKSEVEDATEDELDAIPIDGPAALISFAILGYFFL